MVTVLLAWSVVGSWAWADEPPAPPPAEAPAPSSGPAGGGPAQPQPPAQPPPAAPPAGYAWPPGYPPMWPVTPALTPPAQAEPADLAPVCRPIRVGTPKEFERALGELYALGARSFLRDEGLVCGWR